MAKVVEIMDNYDYSKANKSLKLPSRRNKQVGLKFAVHLDDRAVKTSKKECS